MHEELKAEYQAILRSYLDGAGETAVLQAYDFTRKCLREGLAPDDVMEFHLDQMERIGSDQGALAAQSLLLEIVMAFSLNYRQTMEELERANQELEKVSRFKTRMLSMVAHDLTNHVTAIHLLARSMQKETEGALAEKLEHILEVVEDEQSLLSNLLDLSRLERGRLELDLRPLDLHALAERCVQKARKTAANHTFELSGEVLSVMGDRGKVQQILDNLIGNAVKYSPSGGLVTVRLGTADGLGVVEIADSGLGIPQADLANIFEPFFRSAGASQTSAGSGLGLSIVRSLLGLQQGTIEVDSVLGQGSTFRFKLPLAPSLARATSP